jgi:hypothetical protein
MGRAIPRYIPTASGVVRAHLRTRTAAEWLNDVFFAWSLGEETGDPSYLAAFTDDWMIDYEPCLRALSLDPAVIRRSVDDLGLRLDQDRWGDVLPSRRVPTTVGVVTIRPYDVGELLLLDDYLAAVDRWRDRGDARELRPFAHCTVRTWRPFRLYRLLTRTDALNELIARGDWDGPRGERGEHN